MQATVVLVSDNPTNTWRELHYKKIADRIWIQRTRNLNGGVPSALKDYPTILKSCYIFYEQKKKKQFWNAFIWKVSKCQTENKKA